MELLSEINDKDVGAKSKEGIKYRLRRAARAVIFDNDSKVAILHVSKRGYHKLPGGGFEEGEDVKAALNREVMEETGCTINAGEDVGLTIETRDEFEIVQLSYCFIGDVKKNRGKLGFTEKEISQGFELIWVSLDEAIRLIKNDKPENYEGKYIVKRDLIFLEKAKEILDN